MGGPGGPGGPRGPRTPGQPTQAWGGGGMPPPPGGPKRSRPRVTPSGPADYVNPMREYTRAPHHNLVPRDASERLLVFVLSGGRNPWAGLQERTEKLSLTMETATLLVQSRYRGYLCRHILQVQGKMPKMSAHQILAIGTEQGPRPPGMPPPRRKYTRILYNSLVFRRTSDRLAPCFQGTLREIRLKGPHLTSGRRPVCTAATSHRRRAANCLIAGRVVVAV